MNDEKSVKIDIFGSIGYAIGQLAQFLLLSGVILFIFGCLVAPIFSKAFDGLFLPAEKTSYYEVWENLDTFTKYKKILIRIVLWIICILAWWTLIKTNQGTGTFLDYTRSVHEASWTPSFIGRVFENFLPEVDPYGWKNH